MDTIKFQKKNVKTVAHRGASGLELENTCAAFVAAGNRSYFGIETDVHVTADGKFIVIHDDDTLRVSGRELSVEGSGFDRLRQLSLVCKDGSTRTDLRLPSLEEYLSICRRYEKVAVLELKNPMEKSVIEGILEECKRFYDLENMIFISFDFQNLVYLRQLNPAVQAQYLLGEAITREQIRLLADHGLDLDIRYRHLTRELVEELHSLGIAVNCWTVDDPQAGEMLASWGVDMITTNILE